VPNDKLLYYKKEELHLPRSNFTSIFVVSAQNVFSQNDNKIQYKHPEWSYDKTIYEVNIRQYTPEGTFKAFANHLPRLKKMGVGILWFMPVHPWNKK
jgi:1,4-alpha-glucan branching enzyme